MTLLQIYDDSECWSLEEDDGLTVHYVADTEEPRGRIVLPVTSRIIERMAARLRETPIGDDRQNIIPFPRAA